MDAESNCWHLLDWMMPDPSPINNYDNARLFLASCEKTAIDITVNGEDHLSDKQYFVT
jgi:hypothetical protein